MELEETQSTKNVVPFLKWAGGKRWLVQNYSHLLPKTYERYVEPFLGSGAVFFHMQPKNSILADRNGELIQTYGAIKDNWTAVEEVLKQHHRKHSKEYYYKIRKMNPRTTHTSAARLIYLNRTCWNGLYRVNLNGQFNVPIGTKTRVILDTDRFKETSKSLENAQLVNSDFESTIKSVSSNDFLFVDPPYTVKHNFNGFIKYNEKLFTWEDQIRLRDCLVKASEVGAKIVMTNADHESIRQLYQENFQITRLERHSKLAADSSNRGLIGELLITN